MRLQFFEDALYENAVFSDTTLSVYPPWDNSEISIFEGCLLPNCCFQVRAFSVFCGKLLQKGSPKEAEMKLQISLIFGSIFWSKKGAKREVPAIGGWGPAGCATEREDLGGVQNCKRTLQERNSTRRKQSPSLTRSGLLRARCGSLRATRRAYPVALSFQDFLTDLTKFRFSVKSHSSCAQIDPKSNAKTK